MEVHITIRESGFVKVTKLFTFWGFYVLFHILIVLLYLKLQLLPESTKL